LIKKILLIVLLFTSVELLAQDQSILGFNIFTKISLVFRDGEVLHGIGKINIDNQIVFKRNKDDKKEFYDYIKVKELIFIDKYGHEKRYVYKIVENSYNASVKLLEIIVNGKVQLYKLETQSSIYMPPMHDSGVRMSTIGNYVKYYITKNDEDIVITIKNNNIRSSKFKRFVNKHLADCPDLPLKIKSGFFKNKALITTNNDKIENIIKYYNDSCVK